MSLTLLLALLGCALSDVQGTKTVPPTATPAKYPTPSVHEVAKTTTLISGNTGPATATCPQGEFALGGGWSAPTQGARVFAAFVSGGAWSVSVIPLGHPETTTVTAYVECLSGVNSAVVTRRERMFTMSPHEISDATSNEEEIACNDGEILVGFGFDFGASSRYLDLHGIDAVGLGPPEVSHWTLAVRNHDTVPHAITLYAQRLSNVTIAFPLPQSPGNVKPVIVQASYYTFPDPAGGTIGVPVDPGKSGFLQRECPAGTIVAGGGLYYEGGDSGSLTFLRAAPAGWQGEMLNDGARLPLFL